MVLDVLKGEPSSVGCVWSLDLFGRTWHGRVGAEHTTISVLRAKGCTAPPALVINLAGISGHHFRLLKPAMWTGHGGVQRDHVEFFRYSKIMAWRKSQMADRPTSTVARPSIVNVGHPALEVIHGASVWHVALLRRMTRNHPINRVNRAAVRK